jgi:carboxypeptidase Taq
MDRWTDFDGRMREIKDLDGILGLLGWDEETYAPRSGRAPRGRHTGTLEAIRHERLSSPALGDVISTLLQDRSLPLERRAMVERVERRRERALRVPATLVKAMAEARSLTLAAWQEAKGSNDFAHLAPKLDRVLELSRERADCVRPLLGPAATRYDALLDDNEPGMTAARLGPLLAKLREFLVPLVARIGARPRPDTSFLRGKRFDPERQWQFTMRLLRDLGFDLDRGRQDRSAHPFTQGISEHDVRVTTRIFEDEPLSAISSTIHEAGHGMYEQGFLPAFHGTSIADAPSAGIHESQSRLWENQVGRSRAFWKRTLPLLKEFFPAELGQIDLEAFYRAVNFVEPGLIRVDADEVTYNLHILVRFELEVALLSGDLAVSDLPGAWNSKMKTYLGVSPKTDSEGCMQDIHWPWGAIGYFPTYTIGNLYSAQLMSAFEREVGGAEASIERGEYGVLLSWLRDKVHHRGWLDTAEETIRRATGSGLDPAPFMAYLEKKFGDLYP